MLINQNNPNQYKRDTFLVDCKCEPTTTGKGAPYETEYHVPEFDSKVYYG